jgi:hypothetical protein
LPDYTGFIMEELISPFKPLDPTCLVYALGGGQSMNKIPERCNEKMAFTRMPFLSRIIYSTCSRYTRFIYGHPAGSVQLGVGSGCCGWVGVGGSSSAARGTSTSATGAAELPNGKLHADSSRVKIIKP